MTTFRPLDAEGVRSNGRGQYSASSPGETLNDVTYVEAARNLAQLELMLYERRRDARGAPIAFALRRATARSQARRHCGVVRAVGAPADVASDPESAKRSTEDMARVRRREIQARGDGRRTCATEVVI